MRSLLGQERKTAWQPASGPTTTTICAGRQRGQCRVDEPRTSPCIPSLHAIAGNPGMERVAHGARPPRGRLAQARLVRPRRMGVLLPAGFGVATGSHVGRARHGRNLPIYASPTIRRCILRCASARLLQIVSAEQPLQRRLRHGPQLGEPRLGGAVLAGRSQSGRPGSGISAPKNTDATKERAGLVKDIKLSRRRLLQTVEIAGAAVAVTFQTGAAAQAAPPAGGAMPTWRGFTLLNGWPVLEQTAWHSIEGSGQRVKLVDGAAAILLTHVARRFHHEIDQLRDGDIQGHRESFILAEPYESNYLSGSAIAIRPQASRPPRNFTRR